HNAIMVDTIYKNKSYKIFKNNNKTVNKTE
ncbi:MAG: hypothetical protein RLZZ439_285, partial [Pseudomonadota bacterium]